MIKFGAMAVSTSSATLFQPEAQQRALLVCVGASIALHAAALLAFPEMRGRASASPMILTATLSPSGPAREPAPAAETPKRAEPPQAKRKPRPIARPEPQPEMARPAPAVEPSAASAPEQSAVADAPAAAPDPAPAQAAAPAESTPRSGAEVAIDGTTRKEYSRQLWKSANQLSRYPIQARERGWEGRVEIRITVRPTGAIEAALKTPSGHQILDDQALDMVKRALARTPMPPSLRGREFYLDIPVTFELQSG